MNNINSKINQPQPIPVIVRVGVTGHRNILRGELIRKRIREVIKKLDKLLNHTPHSYVVISPLAEGADRMVAKEILEWKGKKISTAPVLEVELPLAEEEYRKDFDSEDSQKEFSVLLERASSVTLIENQPSREIAYERVGHRVVQNCDVVIAVWDKKSAKGIGGTAEIVQYAKNYRRTIFLINSENGKITTIPGKDQSLEALKRTDSYNQEKMSQSEYLRALRDQEKFLVEKARNAEFKNNFLDDVIKSLLPHYIKADLLAIKYQTLHSKSVGVIYILATIAVTVVTFQALFFPNVRWLGFLEIISMLLVFSFFILSARGDWHRKWIDYRALAERLRGGIFLIWVDGNELSIHKSKQPSYGPNEWMENAFDEICEKCVNCISSNNIPFENYKKFVLDAWIYVQEKYYEERAEQNYRNHELYFHIGVGLFFMTLIVAIVHVSPLIFGLEIIPEKFENLFTFIAIVFPSSGAALAGLRAQGEHERIAEHYIRMVPLIKFLIDQTEACTDFQNLIRNLKEVNEVLLSENVEWRLAFLYQKLELP